MFFFLDVLHLVEVPSRLTFCTMRGTVGGVLRMSEDAVVGESTSFAKTGGCPPHTSVLPRPCAPVVGAITIVMPVCR